MLKHHRDQFNEESVYDEKVPLNSLFSANVCMAFSFFFFFSLLLPLPPSFSYDIWHNLLAFLLFR